MSEAQSTGNEADMNATAAAASTASAARSPSGGAILIYALSGVAAAVIGGTLMIRGSEVFRVVEPPELAGTQGIYTAEQRETVRQLQLATDFKNFPLGVGLLGLTVAACMGIASGVSTKSTSSMISGGMVGAILGAIGGAAGAAFCVFLREQLRGWNLQAATGEPDALMVQLHTMAIQLPSWLAIAAAASLAATGLSASGLRQFGPTFVSAAAGVLIATLLYPTAASVIFQHEDPDLVVPTGAVNRYFWAASCTVIMALMIGRHMASVGTAKK